jgi:hypothetical protein
MKPNSIIPCLSAPLRHCLVVNVRLRTSAWIEPGQTVLRRTPLCRMGRPAMSTPSVALDDDFARVTGSHTRRLTAAFLAFLAADIASALATLFWL